MNQKLSCKTVNPLTGKPTNLMNKLMLCLFAVLVCIACQSKTGTVKDEVIDTEFRLRPGDILFQDSDCGSFCEAIEKVTFGVGGSKFSHVGMVIPKESGQFVVIEAISVGVVETPLDSFFNRSFDENHNSKVVVGRMKDEYQGLIPDAVAFAKTKIGAEYDEVFDISNEKYYCSELLYESFKHANKGESIFELRAMTYKDPDTKETFPIWEAYFEKLDASIPEGEPGLNPGGMSTSSYVEIVHFYGRPRGYRE